MDDGGNGRDEAGGIVKVWFIRGLADWLGVWASSLLRALRGQSMYIRSVMSNSLWPHELHSPWNSPGQNTGADSLSLHQGIFPTQGLNPRLSHCRWILYRLNYKGAVLSSLQKLKGSIHLYSFLTSVLHENFRKKVLNKCAYWQLILNNVLKRTDFPNLSIWLVMYILLLKGKLKATFSSKYLRVGTKSV